MVTGKKIFVIDNCYNLISTSYVYDGYQKKKKNENNFHHRLPVSLNLEQFQSCITLIEKKNKKKKMKKMFLVVLI